MTNYIVRLVMFPIAAVIMLFSMAIADETVAGEKTTIANLTKIYFKEGMSKIL